MFWKSLSNVSKGSAEVDFCLSKGIDPSEAIHFGDSMNDSSAKAKNWKINSYGNSVEELKQMGDDITEHECNNSGLARYLEKNF
ncbi:HAD hydrolase family protein [Mycoplasmopsis cynos]|uniref:HAD family hydrolase n=1 Tax=Mycoplasmopsis cynos TaxID=171284 RepID=UPI0024CCC7AE|nr:HAD hydrolase family protein [Mycoplasmopsis cynos]WAM11087.1 HAD hydrolase family protein [Mycoplasmopsis cynos]